MILIPGTQPAPKHFGGSGTFKAIPVRDDPAVTTIFIIVGNNSSNLSAFLS